MTQLLAQTDAALLRPLRAGALVLPNRLVMAPMTRNRVGADGVPTPATARYYGQRAGAGLIVTEATAPAPDGFAAPGTPGLFTDAQEAGWRRVAEAVHAAGGRLVVQLCHAGRATHPDVIGGRVPGGPSAVAAGIAVPTPAGPAPAPRPRELGRAELDAVAAAFADAARRAIRAGADGVEVHAGNGFLLDQFLSPVVNRRADAYGGSLERRLAFPLAVVDAVCAAAGAERTGVRLSPGGTYNDMADPAPLETLAALVERLAGHDLAYLHVIERPDKGASAVAVARAGWPGALIANGPLGRSFDDRERLDLVSRGHADAVSMGRAFLANPDLPQRLRRGDALTEPDAATFYGGGERGYTDYAVTPA